MNNRSVSLTVLEAGKSNIKVQGWMHTREGPLPSS